MTQERSSVDRDFIYGKEGQQLLVASYIATLKKLKDAQLVKKQYDEMNKKLLYEIAVHNITLSINPNDISMTVD
jgi:hypothetical protein